ncbi:T9SS type B sorting domain-containing protein [Flagellimonas meridianipacifica]|uniref:Gliding motility-associated-like protein n=1 Tax=Flagellimonas meridianipacifica TaxID=1080225 RepID=A0A2T0M981_9FLAO|nr:T9SS type B sorting domain-containing protein [Allomuricauda pacifica]PRX54097.1 gliding motility-associated-like protein [Allomuricauda pacifica]
MLKGLLFIIWVFSPFWIIAQGCPQILSPVPGSNNVPVDVTISWQEVFGVPSYNISIGTTPGGNDIVDDVPLGTSTSYKPPLGLPEDTQIFVTITLFFFSNPSANITCPSISFRTEDITTPPNCTQLRLPENGDSDVNFRTNLRWNLAPGATSYLLRIGTTPNGSEILPETNVGNVLRFDPPNDLPVNSEIFVQITPLNENGQAVNCAVESFRTTVVAQSLDCTRLTFPVNGATNVPLTPLLQWEEVPGATGYRVTIGTTPGGDDLVREREFTSTSTFVIDFEPNALLFISIVPFNDFVEATDCGSESFSTAVGCGPFFDPSVGDFVSLFPELDFPESFVLCENSEPLTLSTNTVAESYRWASVTSRGTEIELLSETSEVQISEGGIYRLDVTDFVDSNGNNIPCTSSQTFTVNVAPGPTVNSVDVERIGDNLTLMVNVSGNGVYEYAINDINGPYQNSNVFTNVPRGNNIVYVRDTSLDGCTLPVDVSQDLVSEGFPKFFTPNGDGINDFWRFELPPNAEEVQFASISIFDKFGRLLFQMLQSSEGWNGTFNGRPLPSSDYWFRAIDTDNRVFQGHFTLKR